MSDNQNINKRVLSARTDKDIYIQKGLLNSSQSQKGHRPSPGFSLKKWLIGIGLMPNQCCDCQCGYDTSGVDFSSPVTVQTWVVNGVTITIDLSADNWSQVADILTNLGFGTFSITINSSDVVDGGICAPQNGNTFGTLTIDDGTEYGASLELECPIVIVD